MSTDTDTQARKDEEFASQVDKALRLAMEYRDQLAPDRIKAMQYFDGNVSADIADRAGWSKVVSRDVSATLNKVLPGITRVILSSDIVGEFAPNTEEDEELARQITDYMNTVVFKNAEGDDAFYDAIHDALLLRNGILYTGIKELKEVTGGSYTGLDEMSLHTIIEDEGVEIIGGDSKPDKDGNPTYDVKVKRTKTKKEIVIEAVPPEEYLVHPDARTNKDALLVGRQMRVRKSSLVAEGFDRERVDALASDDADYAQSVERVTRRRNQWDRTEDTSDENELVTYYDIYIRLDYDDDGIAELRHVVMAGGTSAENMFVNDYAGFVPYTDVVAVRRPHQWEGVSIADDIMDITRIKTALLRYAMDNTYQHVVPQRAVNVDKLANGNVDAIMNPEPGRPILLTGVDRVQDAIQDHVSPYVADKALEAVRYWDLQIEDRTGIDDSSAGLPDDALQNVTAKASAMLEQKGIARIEMMTRTVAKCLRHAFSKLLRIVSENQDKERTVRLRDKWVPIDPRGWDAEMDVNINTGLGAGTRERDLMAMQSIVNNQAALLAQMGADNLFVKANNLHNALRDHAHAAGVRKPEKYYSKPDDTEVEAKLQKLRNQPDPEMLKVQAQVKGQMEMKKMEIEAEVQHRQLEMQSNAHKEMVQGQAAVEERRQVSIIEQEAKDKELLLKKYEIDTKAQIEREKMAAQAEQAAAQRQDDVAKHEASAIGDGLVKAQEAGLQPAKKSGPQLAELISKLEATMARKRNLKVVRDPKSGDMTEIIEAA